MSFSPTTWIRSLTTTGTGRARTLLRPAAARLLGARRPVAVGSAGLAVLMAVAGVGAIAEGGGRGPAGRLTPERVGTLAAASASCPTLTAARLAGQVMATSGFEPDARTPRGGSGVAGLTDEEWRRWMPWPGADRDDPAANVHALARHMCDMIGRLRTADVPGDPWAGALAAFDVGLAAVGRQGGVPPEASGYVATVTEYAVWYAARPEIVAVNGPESRRTVLAAGSAPRDPGATAGSPTGTPTSSPTTSPAASPAASTAASPAAVRPDPPSDAPSTPSRAEPAGPPVSSRPATVPPRTARSAPAAGPARTAVPLVPGRRVSLQVTTAGLTTRHLRHRTALGFTEVVDAGSGPNLRADATFTVRPGLADGGCLSFESVNFPDHYLRHYGFRVRKDPRDGSALFDADATFCPEPGRAGPGVSLRAYNLPGAYVRHRGAEVWVARRGGPGWWDSPDNYESDVTWLPVTPWAP